MKKLIILMLVLGTYFRVYTQTLDWVKHFTGMNNLVGSESVVDNSGDIYTIGNFLGTVDFDPSSEIFNLTAVGSVHNMYITKLDSFGNFIWAKQFITTTGNSIALDSLQNIVVVGDFSGDVDFDPNVGEYILSANSINPFICKLDSSGNFIWAKQFEGETCHSYSITIDSQDNIITTGLFTGTTDFDPSTGTYSLTAYDNGTFFTNSDIYVSKLDNNGNFIYAKLITGAYLKKVSAIASDNSNNIYLTGAFKLTLDFDPSPDEFNLTAPNSNGISNFGVFVLKLDSNGTFSWAKQWGGFGENNEAYDITVDSQDNVLTTGYFYGSADFDPGDGNFNLTASDFDIFVNKLDSSGNFIWAKQLGGPGWSYGYSLTTDSNGNAYLSGNWFGTVDFDPSSYEYHLVSTGVQDLAGDYNIFVCKLDSFGDFSWAVQLEGDGFNNGRHIILDGSDVYVTGQFNGTVDFDPSTDTFPVTPNVYDAYVLKLNQNNLSISERTYSSIKIFPNPVNDYLNIISEKDILNSEIYTLMGELIKTNKIANQINLKNLQSGMYLLKIIMTDNQTQIIRLIKN